MESLPVADPRGPFPGTGGECAAILRSLDWDRHPLGPPSAWPAELTTAVRIALTSRFASMVHWGGKLFTFYNDAYALRLGHKHPGHLGQPAFDWWSEMWDQLEPFFARVLAGESFYTEDARYTPDRDGAPKEAFFTHSHSPLWDAEGRVAGIFVVVTETTRQVLAERARATDEMRNQQVLDSATDFAIIATDLAGQVTRWNLGATGIFGWTQEEMRDQPIDRIFDAQDREAGRPEAERRLALQTGHSNDERWHLRADGTRFWAQGKMNPLRNVQDEVVGFVKVLSDRTEDRRRNQRLDLLAKASAGLLSAQDPDELVHDILQDGADVLGYDQSLSYVYNGSCEELSLMFATGVSEDVQAWLRQVPAHDVPLCGMVALQGEPLILEDVQSSTDARLAPSRAHGVQAYAGFPIRAGDRLYGVLSFMSLRHRRFDPESVAFFHSLARFTSIGRERLEREARLSNLAMTLEQRVEDKTRALMDSEAALRQSQKMDAVGQLTGGVAHDFNNLLTVIKGSVDLLRRTKAHPERQDRYIEAIASTTERAAKLTSQLLAFARRQTLRPETFEVGRRLAGLNEMLQSLVGGLVDVRLVTGDRPCHVHADVSQFETAIVNMAVNARDAMNGVGDLTIALACVDSMPGIRGHHPVAAPFAAISITDTGGGIHEAHLEKIFEPFFTTKEVGKGTGLGLSQVFGFAKQSGGDVDVESRLRHGTTFRLYLPEVPLADASEARSAELGTTDGAGLRVLVVEDNVEVGKFCEQALQDYGFDVTLASSAEHALTVLRTDRRFDVVFSDVVMPGMGGLELAKSLSKSLPHLPILLASGYSHILAQEGSHGFEVVQKPYSAEQVGRALIRAARKGTGS